MVVLSATVAPVARADDQVPSDELLTAVNATRAASGIPPVELDAKMTQGCREWVDYLHQNGGFETEFHEETPGNPGYTELGRMAAQRANGGFTLRKAESPLFSAPKHRVGFLDPRPLKAGLAERKIGDKSYSCQWYALFEDADLQPQRRAPATPRAYTVPPDRATGTWTFERASEQPHGPAYDVGFAQQPDELYTAGMHVFLYHDDMPSGTRMNHACRGALLGPGGRPVVAPLFAGSMLVPKDPFLPGGRYRVVATFSPDTACTTPQRSTLTSFTTRPRPRVTELLKLGDPHQRDGRWYADTFIDELLRSGTGTILKDFDNVHGQYQWDLSDWWAGGRPPEDLSADADGSMTYTLRNDLVRIGPACWSPTTVSRTYTKTAAGVTAGPTTVTPPTPDPCDDPPVPSAPVPMSGAPGTVVRIAGAGVATATAVDFGGVPAKAWDIDGDALRVTVPARARPGPVSVRTPTGAATATLSFAVPKRDTAAPDTWLDLAPMGGDEASTVHVAFSSTEGAGSFNCRVDGNPPKACASPLAVTGLDPGPHQLAITAVDAKGNPDPTPATAKWTVTQIVGEDRETGVATGLRPTLRIGMVRLALGKGELVAGAVTVLRRSRVKVTFRAGGLAIAPVTRTVAAGATSTIRARLSPAARRKLQGVKRLRVALTVTISPLPSGTPTVLRRVVRVRP